MGDPNIDIDIDISRGAINCAKTNTNMWLHNDGAGNCDIIDNAKKKIDVFNNIGEFIKPIFPPTQNNIKDIETDKEKILYKWDNLFSCENWYDWFTISDYHNGNKVSIAKDANDDYKCYDYCNNGIPYENNKCVKRDEIYNGEFKGTSTITPYALIILMGSTKKDIIELYKDELENRTKDIENNLKYELDIDTIIKDKLINDEDIQTEIFNKIKNVMKKSITELIEAPDPSTSSSNSHKYIKGHNNVTPPINNLGILNIKPKEKYSNLTILNKAYEISKKLNDFLSNSNKDKEFQLWKEELKKISDYDIYSWKFNKQLLLLQSACMCCFSKQNKKNILYKLYNDYNEYILGNSYDKNIYNLNFKEITELQIFKATNEANSVLAREAEVAVATAAAASSSSEERELYIFDTIYEKEDYIFKDRYNDYIDHTIKNKDININLLDNSFNSNIIMYFNFFILALLMIVFLFLIYKIITITSIWNSFANVFTYILFGFIYIKEVMFFILMKALACGSIIAEPIWPQYAAKNSILKIHNGTIVGQSNYYEIKSKINLKISNDKIKLFIYGCGLLIIIIVLLNQFMDATSILTKVKEKSLNYDTTSSIIQRLISPLRNIADDKIKDIKEKT